MSLLLLSPSDLSPVIAGCVRFPELSAPFLRAICGAGTTAADILAEIRAGNLSAWLARYGRRAGAEERAIATRTARAPLTLDFSSLPADDADARAAVARSIGKLIHNTPAGRWTPCFESLAASMAMGCPAMAPAA